MAEIAKLSGKQTDNFLAQRRLRDSGQPQSEEVDFRTTSLEGPRRFPRCRDSQF